MKLNERGEPRPVERFDEAAARRELEPPAPEAGGERYITTGWVLTVEHRPRPGWGEPYVWTHTWVTERDEAMVRRDFERVMRRQYPHAQVDFVLLGVTRNAVPRVYQDTADYLTDGLSG